MKYIVAVDVDGIIEIFEFTTFVGRRDFISNLPMGINYIISKSED